MFKIIESILEKPIRFLTDKSRLEPGLIVQLTEIDGNPCCMLSDGSRPFGVVGSINEPFDMVGVYFDSMVFQTTKFEKRGDTYNPGDMLYVSKRGRLTTIKPYESSHLVGHVIIHSGSYIEVNWI